MFDHKHYVPIIRWKEAERLALRGLGRKERARMTPLIEVTPKALASKGLSSPKDVDRGLGKVAVEIVKDWGDGPLFIDLGLIEQGIRASGGTHPLKVLFEDGNRRFLPSFIPVTALDRDAAYQDAVKSVVAQDRLGLCLRIRGPELLRPGLPGEVDRLLMVIGLEYEDIDVVVDYGIVDDASPNFAEACQRLPNLFRWRTFTIVSGAFPEDLRGMTPGEHELPRRDWQAWRDQVTARPLLPRLPSYGDYVIAHPVFKEPRPGLNPSASIRYAAEDYWVIMRGEAIRNDDGPGLLQYPANASLLCDHLEFRGEDFSSGDRYIKKMAEELGKNGSGCTGSLKTWLQAGVNHHLTLTVRQISSLFDSSVGSAPQP